MYTVPKYRTTLVRDGELSYSRKFVTSDQAAEAVVRSLLALEPVECILVLYVAKDGRLIGVEHVARGGGAQCAVTPADIFRGAIVAGASAVVVAHNHPSGSSSPSPEDVVMTDALIQAGRLLGIGVLDHLILARDVGDGCHVTCLRTECAHLPWQS